MRVKLAIGCCLALAAPVFAQPQLQVVGNQIVDETGQAVWLQGVNIPSLEWTPAGERVLGSVAWAISDWGCSLIRLPLSAEYWFAPGDDGPAYRALVDSVVGACVEADAYIILDLHAYRAPTEVHLEFWRDAASRYANHPAVLFGLLNEPHDIDWATWRDGGPVSWEENGENLTAASPGMQGLVDSIRLAGADNLLVAAGLDWGYDLSGVVDGYALEDPGGRGIVYDSHIYPWKSDWEARVLAAAARYPVLIGEVGCETEPMPWIPPEQHKDPYLWGPRVIGMIQEHRLHWTAWCMHPGATPRLIQDWEYAPTPFWGAFVKAALRGAEFAPGHRY